MESVCFASFFCTAADNICYAGHLKTCRVTYCHHHDANPISHFMLTLNAISLVALTLMTLQRIAAQGCVRTRNERGDREKEETEGAEKVGE